MIPSYFDLLSGEPVYIETVGRMRSPLLKELFPSSGIGLSTYNFYLNLLSWEKETVLEYDAVKGIRGYEKLKRDDIGIFDTITLLQETRELYAEVLSFFIVEDIIFDEAHRCYVSVMSDGENSKPVGIISRDNFEFVRDEILKFNYIGLDKEQNPVAHSSEKSKELWEKAQEFLKQQNKKKPDKDNSEYSIANIISKVCASNSGYTYSNIFDLTIYQLYDAFFQIGYLRSVNLSEEIFSNHGGDKFQFTDWLKPINKNL